MKKRLLIIFVLLSFVIAGPASAVKRVPKSGDQPATDQKQRDTQAKPTPDKVTPPPERHQDAKPSQPQQPQGSGDKDRFIDRDGDGINDNLKKPPETIRRKHDDNTDRHHQRGTDSPKPDAKKPDTEKTNKDRRSR